MVESVKWVKNNKARENGKKASVEWLKPETVKSAKKFHESFSMYSKTPLVRLKNLSEKLGVSEILVKDESYRFGLNAFKVLGGSYAIGNLIAQKLGVSIDEVTFDMLRSKEVKEKLGDMVFTSATDGNHGRAVAWSAQQLGQKAVIYMPKGSSQTRLDNIRATGAEASILDVNYDDAVRHSLDQAKKYGWEIVQDTAWDGYTEIPVMISQGYATMMLEILEQLEEYGIDKPTHVFVQAGVGALAGAVQGFLVAAYGEEGRPITTVVEPRVADCLYRSGLNGRMTNVTGDLFTIMAGLACGEPNPITWPIIGDYADAFTSCEDFIAANGMRVLANPIGDDKRVISGESGAAPAGLMYSILTDDRLSELKEQLKITKDSKILLISTEGDTDPDKYRQIVWEGEHPNDMK